MSESRLDSAYKHQQSGVDLLVSNPFFAIHDEMGTGKTKMAIDAATILFRGKKIEQVVVVCPLTVIRQVWEKELSLRATEPRLKWHLINYEKIWRQGYADMIDFSIPTAMILDEAHRIKTPRSKQTKGCLRLGKKALYRWELTGTPLVKDKSDLWAQFEFLSPIILNCPTLTVFLRRYAVMGGYVTRRGPVQVVAWKNEDELQARIKKYSRRILKKDCLDLPEKIFTSREVPLTAEQWKHYKSIRDELYTMIEPSTLITTNNVLTQTLRLAQITAGQLPGAEFQTNKVATLLDVLSEHTGSFAVFTRFKDELHYVSRHLHDIPLSTLSGDMSEKQRHQELKRFHSREARGIVMNVAVGGVGITLVEADLVVYMSNTYSWMERAQSIDRFHRPGQTRNVTYVDILATTPTGRDTIDHRVLKILQGKKHLSEVTLGDIVP